MRDGKNRGQWDVWFGVYLALGLGLLGVYGWQSVGSDDARPPTERLLLWGQRDG